MSRNFCRLPLVRKAWDICSSCVLMNLTSPLLYMLTFILCWLPVEVWGLIIELGLFTLFIMNCFWELSALVRPELSPPDYSWDSLSRLFSYSLLLIICVLVPRRDFLFLIFSTCSSMDCCSGVWYSMLAYKFSLAATCGFSIPVCEAFLKTDLLIWFLLPVLGLRFLYP